MEDPRQSTKDIHIIHKELYGTDAALVLSSPAILTFMGEHTELFGGDILAAAIDCHVDISLSPRDDCTIQMYSANYREKKKASVQALKYRKEDRWANYLKGAAAVMMELGCPVSGMDIAVQSCIPPHVGLGSSSALTAAMIGALQSYYNFAISDEQLAQTLRLGEMKFTSKDPGSTASVIPWFSRNGQALLINAGNMDIKSLDMDFEPYVFLLAVCQLPNGSGAGESDTISQNLEACKEVLERLGACRDMANLELREIQGELEELPEKLRRQVIYSIEESQRVPEFFQALESRDFVRAGKIMFRSHEGMRDMLEISCPELDWLVKRASETRGVEGARMIGSGFGGCTINLIHVNSMDEYEKHLEEFDRIFGFKVETMVCRAVDGLKYR